MTWRFCHRDVTIVNMSASGSSPSIPAPQGYHHGDLQRALVLAARGLVDSGGAAALTLRAAAQLAGVSATAPYRHFADRTALLAAVLTEGFHDLQTALAAARTAQSDPVAAYLAVGRAYIGFADTHQHLYRLMFGVECNKLMYPTLLAAGQAAFSEVLQAATACEAAGLTGSRSAADVALAGWAVVHGIAALHVDGILNVVTPHTLPEATDALLGILVEGIAPR